MASSVYPREGDQLPAEKKPGPVWLRQQALRLEWERGMKRHFNSREEMRAVAFDSLKVAVDFSGSTKEQDNQRLDAMLSLKAGDFCTSQMMSWCCGRPLVPLVITHERSAARNISRHIGDCFCPYPVHYIMGRSAVMEPTCPPEDALWHTWKDSDAEVSSHISFPCVLAPCPCFFR